MAGLAKEGEIRRSPALIGTEQTGVVVFVVVKQLRWSRVRLHEIEQIDPHTRPHRVTAHAVPRQRNVRRLTREQHVVRSVEKFLAPESQAHLGACERSRDLGIKLLHIERVR